MLSEIGCLCRGLSSNNHLTWAEVNSVPCFEVADCLFLATVWSRQCVQPWRWHQWDARQNIIYLWFQIFENVTFHTQLEKSLYSDLMKSTKKIVSLIIKWVRRQTMESLLQLERWSEWTLTMGTNGMDDTGQVTPMDGRMAELEALFLGGPLATKLQVAKSFSIETLLDVLVVLFDECSTSSLRREKTVSEFIELGEYNKTGFRVLILLFIFLLQNNRHRALIYLVLYCFIYFWINWFN